MKKQRFSIAGAALTAALLLSACHGADEPQQSDPPVSAPSSAVTTETALTSTPEATTADRQYRLSVSDGVHGAVAPSGTYRFPAGHEVTLTLTPAPGYELFQAEYGDQQFMTNAISRSEALVQHADGSWRVTFSTLDRDAGFFAYFEPLPQALTLSDRESGLSVSACFRLHEDEAAPVLRVEPRGFDDPYIREFVPNLIDAIGSEAPYALYSICTTGSGSSGPALLSVPVGAALDGRQMKVVSALLSVPVADPYMYRVEETAPCTVSGGVCEIEVPAISPDGFYALILLPEA